MNTDMEIDLKEGDHIYFRGNFEGKNYTDKGIITKVVPNKLLAYNYRSSWSETEDIRQNYLPVVQTIEPVDENHTTLTVEQSCADEEAKLDSEKNWAFVLGEMKKVVEEK